MTPLQLQVAGHWRPDKSIGSHIKGGTYLSIAG